MEVKSDAMQMRIQQHHQRQVLPQLRIAAFF